MSIDIPGVIINNERIIEEHEFYTGAAGLDKSLAPGVPFEFLGFELHLNEAPSQEENFVVKKNAGVDVVYDIEIYSLDLSTDSTKDVVKDFGGVPIKCHHKGDEIDFDWTNTNKKIYGLTAYWRKLKG